MFVDVVEVNFGKVLKENSLSVDFLKLRSILNSELGFPRFELRDLLGGLVLSKQDSSSPNNG